MRRTPLVLAIPILLILTTATGGQQPAVTFRSAIDYVEIDALVTDRNGDFVAGLSQDDFELLEDGQPQEIAVFSLVQLPRETPRSDGARADPANAVEPDVRTNHRAFDGRIYVLVLDDLHTAATSSMAVRAGARRFIDEYLGPDDLMAVVYTSGRQDAMQGFTDSRPLLLASAGQFIGQKLRSATIERIERAEQRLQSPNRPNDVYRLDQISDPNELQRASFASRMLGSLERVSTLLTAVRGRRKALVLFSEGIDYDVRNVMVSANASFLRDETRRVLSAAVRANVGVYAIDPRGLTGAVGDADIELQAPIVEDPTLDLDALGLSEEARLARSSLTELAEETGGRAFVGSNDLSTALDRIVRDNSAYYLLGYQPTNDRVGGPFRRIEVRLKHRPDLDVRTPKSYVVPRGDVPKPRVDGLPGLSPELRDVVEHPVPVAGVTVAAAAAAFDDESVTPSVVVSLRIGPHDLHFSPRDGKYANSFEVAIVAVDSRGEIHDGDHQTLDLDLSPQSHEAVSRQGFQVSSRLSLGPGRYQLLIAVREANAGTIGSVHHDLEVPDFSGAPITISGVAITSAEATLAIPSARSDERLGKVMPGPATTLREFASADEIALYLEIYDNRPSIPHQVEVTTRVLASDGRQVVAFRNEWDSARLGGQPGGFGYAPRIPLKDFAPGEYVLEIEATASTQTSDTAVHRLPFRVRE